MAFSPGSLVKVRGRDWVVLPSDDQDLLVIKPLGGSEDEKTGIYLPLQLERDIPVSAKFPLPTVNDIGDLSTTKLLYNASRLSFRSGAGPFRSLARLSFRPRAYQMVPLIMALKQDPVRLLIADDVGVGKTIEALLVVKELLDRQEIKRFAVVCLPHLCEQWQEELKDKFDIDAVIIRSNTQARLDREIHGDVSVYDYYPFQVISIDYIKSEQRRQVFIQQCPEMIIVDEAHSCARPLGAQKSQQQRYHLLSDIVQKKNQHLMLLTATPHSGKAEEFRSLLGLLKPHFENTELPTASQKHRKEVAQHFIQRKRANVEQWMDEKTDFPKRDPGEFPYDLKPKYLNFFGDMLAFAHGLTKTGEKHAGRKRLKYWTALGLLRGVMSSPAAGVMMLNNRMNKIHDEDESSDLESNPILDEDYSGDRDFVPEHVIGRNKWTRTESQKLKALANELKSLGNLEDDWKAAYTLEIIKEWIQQGFSPVIFCRYILTAKYLGELLTKNIQKTYKKVQVMVVTSEDPDEVRKQRIEELDRSHPRVMFATDCLSEGINLQDYFTAVLHYDLPWNPNRLEQREGRVDRFGQSHPVVKAYLLYGSDNPIDGVVLKVLLRKVREIKRSTGISMPFPEDSKSIMDAVLHSVLLNPEHTQKTLQIGLDFGETDPIRLGEIKATKAYDEAAEREKVSRNIFAQYSIKANEIEKDLAQADESIGRPEDVESFVVACINDVLGAQIISDKKGHQLFTTNLPPALKSTLPQEEQIPISFYSPTPQGYRYIGRNHIFVEQLCQYIMAHSLSHDISHGAARASVIKTNAVAIKTTILLFRVRNVIEEQNLSNQIVAEEMLTWGYKGNPDNSDYIYQDECTLLLDTAKPTANLTMEARGAFLENELAHLPKLKESFDKVAENRSKILVEAHDRFRKVMGGSKFQVVYPVLPMDVMGMYILLPDGRAQ
ncbi:MAG: DEAD/DEAH box helicase [Bacteroidetes bacterium]|nr:DEAD/DEAH box helicase [Bacteroidota bacterium]